jgi:hypothetical protein
MNTTFIYTLEFPEGNIRYIGKSNNPEKRLREHLKDSSEENVNRNGISHKKSWIINLSKQELEPIVNIIDEINIEDWKWCEQYWIAQFKSWGFNLTNLTIGGTSTLNEFGKPWNKGKNGVMPQSWNKGKTGLQKNPMKGKNLPHEWVEKLSISAKNRETVECPFCKRFVCITTAHRWHFENCKLSPTYNSDIFKETNTKISNTLKQYYKEPEFAEKVSLRNKNMWTDEVRDKHKKSQQARWVKFKEERIAV